MPKTRKSNISEFYHTLTLHLKAGLDFDQTGLFSECFEGEYLSFSCKKEKDMWEFLWTFGFLPDEKDVLEKFKHVAQELDLPSTLFASFTIEKLEDRDWLAESYRALPPFTVGSFFIYGSHFEGEKPKNQIPLLALFASRVSIGLSVFLTALAIFDDVGAIAIISIFYAHEVSLPALMSGVLTLALLMLGNRSGIRSGWFYGMLGLLLWFCVFKSGIHATFAGILLALTIPARTVISQSRFILDVRRLVSKFEVKQETDISMLGSEAKHHIVDEIGQSVKSASTPLQRWENGMVMPIAILILPLFAFLNAGFLISGDLLHSGITSPITIGIIVGLVIGKPLGIVGFAYLFSRTRWGQLPADVSMQDVVSAAFLAGIGFTMSIFFTSLSFPDQQEQVELAKLGIMIASVISAVVGSLWILRRDQPGKLVPAVTVE